MDLADISPGLTCRTATNADGEQIRKIVFDALLFSSLGHRKHQKSKI
ncbi:MAG: hypothetical protein WBO36_09490 [Saprospiraceae bacterium]